MKFRLIVCIFSALASLGMVCGVYVQGRQLARLRSQQQRVVSQLSSSTELAPLPNEPAVPVPPAEVPAELLQLRNEVSQLNRRKRELENARLENQRLKQQLETNRTNHAQVIPGYMRRGEARMAGYQTPEATLETFLWSIHNRDMTNFLNTLTPEAAAEFQRKASQSGRPVTQFFDGSEEFIGLGVPRREQLPDGSARLWITPGAGIEPIAVNFKLIGNQWKMSWPQ